MGKIVISTNATVDGVVQDPDGKEGFERGGWFHQFVGNDLEAWYAITTEQVMRAEALLLGRRTDEWFGSRMPSRSGEWAGRVGSEWADRVGVLPKHVVSSNPEQPKWRNSTLLKGDVLKQVAELKQKVDGEILVYGSSRLVRTLLEQDLVDELRLVVFPVVLGTGVRLFDGIGSRKPMRLIGTRKIGDGLVSYTYQTVHD